MGLRCAQNSGGDWERLSCDDRCESRRLDCQHIFDATPLEPRVRLFIAELNCYSQIDEPPTEEHFHLRWEKEVGEDFKHEVGMRLLEVSQPIQRQR